MEEDKQKKIQKLAEDVLILSRNTLLVNLRFLDRALSMLVYVPCKEYTMMTDGKHLFYNAKYLLANFKIQKEIPVRYYLHIVMHCVYRHMFMSPTLDRPLWDLACDIAVENVINELGTKSVEVARVQKQKTYIEELKKQVSMLTAEKVYAYFKETGLDREKAAYMREHFKADDHEIWYMTDDERNDSYDNNTKSGDSPPDGTESRSELSEEWKEISERMQIDIETLSHQGNLRGSLTQNLKEVNREKYDYTAFLKKFAVMGEVMKVNDDEFDYIFYTYGLKLYEKMPLIEPLEYKEVKRIREFVIAIDTSGSVSGELVQKFIEKTYNILKSTESFFSKINLHIIQCDASIQEHIKITSQKEFDEYLKTMQIKGLGGTDFRPVFSFVDKLIKNKEFSNLKGLIYFTDGFGDFPAKTPDYDTAFVFIDEELNNIEVPPWAIKLILRENEI